MGFKWGEKLWSYRFLLSAFCNILCGMCWHNSSFSLFPKDKQNFYKSSSESGGMESAWGGTVCTKKYNLESFFQFSNRGNEWNKQSNYEEVTRVVADDNNNGFYLHKTIELQVYNERRSNRNK